MKHEIPGRSKIIPGSVDRALNLSNPWTVQGIPGRLATMHQGGPITIAQANTLSPDAPCSSCSILSLRVQSKFTESIWFKGQASLHSP